MRDIWAFYIMQYLQVYEFIHVLYTISYGAWKGKNKGFALHVCQGPDLQLRLLCLRLVYEQNKNAHGELNMDESGGQDLDSRRE